ncbi:protein Gawky isoform X1 [Thrips palmi]|uniref:Protein Gawky isoform X1 n=1 Tax=Thrips palmi TaxID=161013 RepID=A0A6P8ZNQ8_THRPL|nr:protein Gawky isoform X1 [Thrips palmi]XP_034242780.1 protein Gawky isoform X1 [Thrips palmi]XP_034242781.1 protein Gawky isoform X1 [Thrips palmi]XP_034242782.1 protein Gawky isoform X1 [Thrips palmi]XP_034242783.1 protein Gawky isoform X1 [Thrips palmi]
MFSNNSSSLEISSVANGSTQNFEDNGVEVLHGAGQSAEPALSTCGNEPVAKEGSSVPTKPVPDMRDTQNCTNDWPGDVGSQVSSVSSTSLASSITSTAAQSTNIESTMQDGLFSKDAPTVVPSLSASEVATSSRSLVKPLHTGCDSCGCCNHHPDDNCASCLKSEACSNACSHQITTQSSAEDASGCLLVETAHKMSVISSSSGVVVATEMEPIPPSLSTSSGAPQSTKAVFACDLDSSSSNKLPLQRFEPSKANGMALPNESKQHHQNKITPAAEIEIAKFPGHLIPSWEEKLTTGALSDQDNNYNKANHSNNSVKEHSQLGGGDAKQSNNAWSLTPFNIPEAEGDGNSRVPQAIQATVQGINDSSNPPASFNNNVNVNDYGNVNDNGTAPVLDKSTILLNDYSCLNLPSDKDREAYSPSKKMNVPYNLTEVSKKQNKDSMEKLVKNFTQLKSCGQMMGPASNARWGIPQGLGLRGGGESSLNNGTTGWGTPPSGNNNSNNNTNNSNNNPGANSAAAAGWGTANSTPNAGNNQGGQSQWGAPNNNRPNTGNNQNAGAPPIAGQSPPQSNPPGQPAPSQPGPQGQPNQPPGQQQTPPGQPQPQPNPAQPPPTSQPPPQNGSNPWSQGGDMAGPNQPPPSGGPPNNNNGGPPNNGSGVPGGLPPTSGAATPAAPSTKQQLEQLNTMREALFSQDGWGGQNVNQDTGWDIPSSPEPATKDNNGTDLWEANLRNGGQPPPQTQQKTPWGHTPTTNIGGTWGEDDEVSDSSNMWTGVPANPGPGGVGPGGPGPQWGAGGPGPGGPGGPGPAGGMWGGPKKDDWNRGSSNWGEPRGDPRGGGGGGDPRMGMDAMGDPRDPRDMRGVGGGGMDPRDMRGVGPNDPRDMRGVDMRGVDMRGDPMRPMDPMRDPRDMRGMADMRGGDPMMRGDPRGISGRLNGGVSDPSMWGQPPQPPHHNMPHHQQSQPPRVGPGGVGSGGNFPGGVNQWAGPPPKDIGMPGGGSKPSGWEEPSPPPQRRNLTNYDDGTSLWGQQQNRMGGGGKVSHWKDMPAPNMGRSMQGCPPGMPQNRMPGNNPGNMKPDNPLWSHPGRNGSWDGPHEGAGGNPWVEEPKGGLGGMNNWNDPPLTPSWGGPKPKTPMNQGGWVDNDMDASWGQPKSGPKPAKEMIWASKQFRMLSDMGYKKDDVENALRVSNMNLENALEMLNASGRMNMDGWRAGHEDHGFDIGGSSHPAGGSGSAFSNRFQSAPPMHYAPPGGPGLNSQPSLINMNNANPSLTNISPALVQKMLMQQPPPQQPPSQQSAPFNQSQRNSQNQPSAQQLQMLVKQIQMAVSAGYLNQQILNQPLSPQTLLLLNQLLQQIKVLQTLTQQHAVVSTQKNSPAMLNISVQLTKTKQQIANLQNQIQAQQALYVKHMPPQGPPDYFKPDPMGAMPSFNDLTIKEPPVMNDQSFQSPQSRLNQWKLPPSLDKDSDGLGNEFSRAPGTTSKAPGLSQSHSSPNINPILSQGDGPWASVSRSNSDTGWPDSAGVIESGASDKDWPITSQSNSFSDLVPEFEPGKPWKGMKSIEDDPNITPGSVGRSPLSLAALKEPEMFPSGGVSKTSPTSSGGEIITPLSLSSSSTWSYSNTGSSTATSFASPLGKLGSKGPWGDGPVPTPANSELWGAPQNKPRGPPPGLSSKNPNGGGNGAAGGGGQGGGGTGSSGSSTSSNGWGRGSGGGNGSGSGGAASWGIQGAGATATPGAGTAGTGTTGTAGWGSTWLLLKNLTPQIDGSTLKTLCLQHGPLQSFHLYLNHGIALAKYQSREEANKAQAALNNCVLSNTTIFAESPSDSEVHNLLSHLGGHGTAQQQQSGGSAPNWGMRSSSGGAGANPGAPPAPGKAPQSSQDTWGSSGGSNSSQLWANTPSSSVLWGNSPMDSSGDQHRATPSAFLPGDLLGGESM